MKRSRKSLGARVKLDKETEREINEAAVEAFLGKQPKASWLLGIMVCAMMTYVLWYEFSQVGDSGLHTNVGDLGPDFGRAILFNVAVFMSYSTLVCFIGAFKFSRRVGLPILTRYASALITCFISLGFLIVVVPVLNLFSYQPNTIVAVVMSWVAAFLTKKLFSRHKRG